VTFIGPPIYSDKFGTGIDRLGAHIIGYVITPTTQGFIQTATGLPKLFPLPPFSSPNLPGGVNSHGEGVLENVDVDANGTVRTIAIPDCTAVTAVAINDLGWVTGSCTHAGQTVGFLWK
jgi:hypothetical protein